jgi:hypothetical protein
MTNANAPLFRSTSKYAEKYMSLQGLGAVFVRKDGKLLARSTWNQQEQKATIALKDMYTPTGITLEHTELIEDMDPIYRREYLQEI